MADTMTTTLIGAGISTALPLLVILLTRERSSGKDHGALTNNTEDIKALKTANVDMQKTLSVHTAIMETAQKEHERLRTQIDTMQREQDKALGREERRRHDGGRN